MSTSDSPKKALLGRASLVLLGLGLAVRALFLLGCDTVTYQGDETRYVYHAVEWMRLGLYSDSRLYQWPPGYPYLLSLALEWFGVQGIAALKALQVAADLVTGGGVMWLASRFFGRRASLVAGGVWATYLPLIVYTSLLRPETLFVALLLSALCVAVSMAGRTADAADGFRAVLLGALLGAAMYLKEAALPYALAMVLGLALVRARGRWPLRLSSGAITLLALIAVVLPWVLRNQEVYGHVGSTGVTLGHNLYLGVNEEYRSLDHPQTDLQEIYGAEDFVHRYLIAAPPDSQWERSEAANVFDRSRENSQRAREYFEEHPGYVLRGRVKRIADALTPLSFVVRREREGWDAGWWNGPAIGPALATISVGQTALLLLLGVLGLSGSWLAGRGRGVMLLFVAAAASTVPLVAMSRFRLPVEPVLIVAAAGLLCGRSRPFARGNSALVALLALGVLGVAWWINWREIAHVCRSLWS